MSDPIRKIELGEPMDAWGAAKDQEGVFWLTCEGLPILNLEATFKRVVGQPHPALVQALEGEIERLRSEIEAGKGGAETIRNLGWDDLADRAESMGFRASGIADRLQQILDQYGGGGS